MNFLKDLPWASYKKAFRFLMGAFLKFVISVHLLIFLTFICLRILPGSFVEDEFLVEDVRVNPGTGNSVMMNLEQNFFFEVTHYFLNVYQFNLGNSYAQIHTTVKEIIYSRYQESLKILSVSFLVTFLGALFLSYISFLSIHLKRAIRSLIKINNVLPNLVIVPVLIYIFCYVFEVFPPKYEIFNLKVYFFVIALFSLKPLFHLTQLVYERWYEEMKSPYVTTAKAKGLGLSRRLLGHGLRNAIPSVLIYSQNIFLTLLGGNFLIESFYSIPGIGLSFVEAMINRDLPLILGCVLVFGAFFLIITFFYDLLIFLVQPQKRLSE